MYIKLKRRKRKNRKTGEYTEDKYYTAIIRFPGGHEFSRSTQKTTYREAEAWAKREASRIEQNELQHKIGENITISTMFGWWWNNYAHKQRSAETMQTRAKTLHEVIGPDFLLSDLNNDYVDELITNLFEGPRGERSPATVNRIVDILKAAIREAKRNKLWKTPEHKKQFHDIDWSEHKQKEPKERVIFLSPDEARILMSHLPKHIALAVAWSIYTGCRLNETRTLIQKKIYPEARYCEVFAKGGEYRNVILSQISLRIVQEALKDQNSRSPLYMHNVFNLENRRKHWEAARLKIDRPEMRWHDLRHVGATWLRQYGNLELTAVGRALGHSGPEVTKRYAHVADSELIEAYESMPDVTGLIEEGVETQETRIAPLI